MTSNIKIAMPVNENYNLTEFVDRYNSLSPYKDKEKKQRMILLADNLLTGAAYNPVADMFIQDGCMLGTIDLSHVYIECNHTTVYGLEFVRNPDDLTKYAISTPSGPATDETENPDVLLEDLHVPLWEGLDPFK